MVLWARRCYLAKAAHNLLHRNTPKEMGGWVNGVPAMSKIISQHTSLTLGSINILGIFTF